MGAIGGGAETTWSATANRCTSIDWATAFDSATASGKCGNENLIATVSAVAAKIPHTIEPRTRRACSPAVTSSPKKNTIRSGEANWARTWEIASGSVISMGVYIGQSTRIYDRENDEILYGRIPAGSVVVSGNLPSKDGKYSLYCAVIVKRVDEKTRSKVGLNELLRNAEAAE